MPYWKAVLLILVVYTMISLGVGYCAGIVFFTRQMGLSPSSPELHSSVLGYLFGIEYLRIFLVWLVILLSTLAVLLVNDKYGPGILRDMLLGKYFHPHREERIFMFLDLRGSTGIAEKLGEEKYFEFIREVFTDATPAILHSRGEIYQYIGDEILISWKMEQGLAEARCIQCFFEIKNIFRECSASYLDRYGIEPDFKAGLHTGPVMAGEIGVVKRDIAFSGDVLNTAARIQGKCNEFGVDILLSKFLLEKLMDVPSNFNPKKIGEILLRGKQEQVILFTV